MNPVTDSDLNVFCTLIEAAYAQAYAMHYPNLTPPVVSFDPRGRKYVRIVRTDSGRSVICFVERSNGDIWKAASWKAPALNFTRGNIHGDISYATR